MTRRNDCCVYVVSSGVFCKIGHAQDVSSRLAALQVSNPFDLRLVYAIRFTSKAIALAIEREAHSILSEKWRRGEWFKIDGDEAVHAIKIARASVGHFTVISRGNIDFATGKLAVTSGDSSIDRDRYLLRRQMAELENTSVTSPVTCGNAHDILLQKDE